MARYAIDTEFAAKYPVFQGISIAIVRVDDGVGFEAVLPGGHAAAESNDWLAKNVLPHLGEEMKIEEVRKGIIGLVGDDPSPEFMISYGATGDFFLFTQVVGGGIMNPPYGNWPKGWPDLYTETSQMGFPWVKGPEGTKGHKALDDALRLRAAILAAEGKIPKGWTLAEPPPFPVPMISVGEGCPRCGSEGALMKSPGDRRSVCQGCMMDDVFANRGC